VAPASIEFGEHIKAAATLSNAQRRNCLAYQGVQFRAQWIGGKLLFPLSRFEFRDAARGMLSEAPQNVDAAQSACENQTLDDPDVLVNRVLLWRDPVIRQES
jgi:hypothetical protein